MPSSLTKEILLVTFYISYKLKMERNYICVINWARGPDREILAQICGKYRVLGLYLVNLPLLTTLRIVSVYQLAHHLFGSRN